MRRLLPDAVVGALAGFGLGVMASINLAYLGVDVSGWPVVGFGILGAVAGSLVGSCLQSPSGRARAVARWYVTTAVALGVVSFLAGFVGPIVLRPDLPQGPMLGIFCTGPLGALAGALLGAVIGLLVPVPSAQR
jgi:hypothetical protein